MQRTLKHLFELGYDLGHKWGTQEKGCGPGLLIQKIEAGDREWVASKCDEIIANYYPDLPAIEGPWRDLFIYGFAAGAYEILPELEKQLKELQKQLEQMQIQMQ